MLFTADFETTTKRPGDPTATRVWAWATASIEDQRLVAYGNDLDGFMGWIGEHPGTYFFHNLAFDGRFIVDYLFKHGWSYTTSKRIRLNKTFTGTIGRLGQWYELKLVFWAPELGMSTVTIRDSLKLLPLSVAAIAKDFGLEEGKGELDYDTWRPEGHELTEEEFDYLRRDVEIMAKALHVSIIDEGMDRLTIGSNAMHSWRKGLKNWRNMFPRLGNVCDTQIRAAYRGGFTWLNPEFKDVDVYGGISVDFNSMYPSMMISKPFPYGEPVAFEGKYEEDPRYPLYVQEMLVTWHLKDGGIPFMKPEPDGVFDEHEYPADVDEPVWIWVTNVDLELMWENYELDVWQWGSGWKFCAIDGERIFGEYVHYWGKKKQESTGGQRLIAKLYLNNLYGKFATRPDPLTKIPVCLDGKRTQLVRSDRVPVIIDGNVEFQDWTQEAPDPVYIPVAAFCTAWARDTLVRAAMANRERFIYCDTDSMHLVGTDVPEGIPIDDNKLCNWKVEGTFSHARHLRAKTYMWDLNDEVDVVCAGMPADLKKHVTWENFHIGFSNLDEEGNIRPGWGKKLARTVEGGVILVDTKFEIRGDID